MVLLRRLVQLYVGLWLYGLAIALQARSGLGLDPWDVLHQGISDRTGLALGTIVIIVGAAVLLLWIPLRERPGLGTVSNALLVGVSVNVSLGMVPAHAPLWVRCIELAGGIVLLGMATGMYIGAHFGPGPRDGLMTGLARTTGRSIRVVRTGIEVVVLAVGWLLGGTVGIGTVLFALLIGPITQIFLPLFDPSYEKADVTRRPRRLGPARWRAGRRRSRTRDAGRRRPAADPRATRHSPLRRRGARPTPRSRDR